MIGKAREIRTTMALCGDHGVDEWLKENPDSEILQILISPGEQDYFYIIYKEPTT